MSQSKISKIETGRVAPSVEDVRVITQILDAPPELIEWFVNEARAVSEELRTFRSIRRLTLTQHQDRVRQLEEGASSIAVYSPILIPGLLQTAEYARNIFTRVRPGTTSGEVASAVAARMQRQDILFDQSRQFLFIVDEAALHPRLASPSVMRAQVDRLLALGTLPNVALGILRLTAPLSIVPLNGFDIFDEDAVAVETMSAELLLLEKSDVGFYVNALQQLKAAADFEPRISAFLRDFGIALG